MVLVTFQVDRVYLSCPNPVAVIDHGKKRTFVIRKDGLPDVGKKSLFSMISTVYFLLLFL